MGRDLQQPTKQGFFSVFSLRAIYGTDELRNALHGSLSISAAEREIRFMFPEGKVVQTTHCQSWEDSVLPPYYLCLPRL